MRKITFCQLFGLLFSRKHGPRSMEAMTECCSRQLKYATQPLLEAFPKEPKLFHPKLKRSGMFYKKQANKVRLSLLKQAATKLILRI